MSEMPSTGTEFDALVRAALAEPVSGWRFPFLEGRRTSDELAWDHSAIARGMVHDAGFVLDHGTGGGEVLAELRLLRELVVATESYAPNVPAAAGALAPLGIFVIQVPAETFDTRGPSTE